jgi:hypothetical protein
MIETVWIISSYRNRSGSRWLNWIRNERFWEHKTQYQRKDEHSRKILTSGNLGRKIVCISVGYFVTKGDIRNFRVTSFFMTKEDSEGFQYLLNNHFNQPQHILCQRIWYSVYRKKNEPNSLPDKLNLFGKKPWEIPSGYVGVMEVCYKHYTSLKLMCKVLGIPSPKVTLTAVK